MNTTIERNFETRLMICSQIAKRHPAWVGREELSQYLTGCTRTHQRLLSGLVSIGYLERSDTNPAGWRVVKSKVKGFRAL